MIWTLTHENEEIQELQEPGTDPENCKTCPAHTLLDFLLFWSFKTQMPRLSMTVVLNTS